ncbi:MAG: NAD(P)-dependent alcohol dehydrogenase [Planctomycetota bacterium]|jgi:NADPH:quinone reductase-like Zn-dependent oxidoreductase
MESMRAIVQHKYGSPKDVLELQEIDKPAPKDDEVRVRVHAAGINIGDWHTMRGTPFVIRLMCGLRAPRIRVPGMDIAGTVEAAGKDVKEFQPGDEVFGWCKGAFAEYACAAANQFVPKPADYTFEQAAAVGVSAFTALHALRDQGKVQPGQRVLIVGASGGVGTFAVQMAKAFGAHVTGVCSTTALDMVRSIGADEVIDYTQEDFAQRGERYDVVLDIYGSRSLADFRRVLTADGTYVLVGGSIDGWLIRNIKVLLAKPFVSQKLRLFVSVSNPDDLRVLADMVEAKKITPVIDRTHPLSETAAAMEHVGAAHARGKTVLTV